MSITSLCGKYRIEKSLEIAVSRDSGAFAGYHQWLERVMGIAPLPYGRYHATSPAFIRHWRRRARVRFPSIFFPDKNPGRARFFIWSG